MIRELFRRRWFIAAFVVVSTIVAMQLSEKRRDNCFRVTSGIATDHFSHMMATIALVKVGPIIYSAPTNSYCKASQAPAVGAFMRDNPLLNPADVCQIPGTELPLAINYATLPRFYPPGAQLFHSVAAGLYVAGTSFAAVNEVIAWQYVFTATLLIALLLWRGPSLFPEEQRRVAYALFALNALHLLRWSLDGFYDSSSLLCLCIAMLAYSQRRWSAVVLAWSAALFFHYRALWFAPLAAFAVVELWRAGKLRDSMWLLIASAALSAAALATLLASYPHLSQMNVTNPLYWSRIESGWLFHVSAALALVLVAVLCKNRNWLRLSVLANLLFFLVATREVRQWHSLFLWPFLYLGAPDSRAHVLLRWLEFVVALAFIAFIARMQFDQSFFDVRKLIRSM